MIYYVSPPCECVEIKCDGAAVARYPAQSSQLTTMAAYGGGTKWIVGRLLRAANARPTRRLQAGNTQPARRSALPDLLLLQYYSKLAMIKLS
jgi:hypothetical protein